MKRVISIVEDEKDINNLVAQYLRKEGYEVHSYYTYEEASAHVADDDVHLWILDIMLDDKSGFDLIEEIRLQGPETPVIFMSARDKEFDRIIGLEKGCDDYITKPFSLSVLRARVNTQLRKAAAMSEKEKDNEHVYRKEPYVFDFDRMKFMVDGKEIELSKTEQKLLRILVENAGMNMRRELLLDRVWSDGAEYVDENALSVSVKRLRDKLGAEHAIRTVYGIGYRWE